MARRRASEILRRAGRELRIARVQLGLSQGAVAARSGVSQSSLSSIELGTQATDLATLAQLATAVGTRLSIQLYPTDRVRLADTGQLSMAQAVIRLAHANWKTSLEVPVAPLPDLRAADLVLESAAEVLHFEIERNLVDLQAQLRAGQVKREALAQRFSRPVRFFLVLPDTARLRRLVDAHREVIAAALPKGSRETLAALRTGRRLGADGLLWIRHYRSPSAQASSRVVDRLVHSADGNDLRSLRHRVEP